MDLQRDAEIDKDWLSVQNYQFKILVMIAVLAENKLAYRGKLKDMCGFLGVGSNAYNNQKIKEAITKLKEKGDILVIQEGQTWTLTLSVKAERKQRVIKIRNAWIGAIQQYKALDSKDSVSWENILKVLVYLIADSKEVKKYEEIAAELGIDAKTVERAVKALDGIDLGDVTIKRKLAWFKSQDKFLVKGQRIDVGYDFSAGE